MLAKKPKTNKNNATPKIAKLGEEMHSKFILDGTPLVVWSMRRTNYFYEMNSIIFTNLSENVVIRHGTHNSCKELNQTTVTREQPISGIEVARMTGKERGKQTSRRARCGPDLVPLLHTCHFIHSPGCPSDAFIVATILQMQKLRLTEIQELGGRSFELRSVCVFYVDL